MHIKLLEDQKLGMYEIEKKKLEEKGNGPSVVKGGDGQPMRRGRVGGPGVWGGWVHRHPLSQGCFT